MLSLHGRLGQGGGRMFPSASLPGYQKRSNIYRRQGDRGRMDDATIHCMTHNTKGEEQYKGAQRAKGVVHMHSDEATATGY